MMGDALRSIAAVMGGFGFMLVTVIVGTSVASAMFVPGTTAIAATPPALPATYLAAHLVASAMGAVIGGWLAARIATRAPFAHAIVLAVVLASMSIVSAMSTMSAPSTRQPLWYGPLVSLLGVAGVLIGGSLRAAAARPSSPPA